MCISHIVLHVFGSVINIYLVSTRVSNSNSWYQILHKVPVLDDDLQCFVSMQYAYR